jgi:peptidoglycan/xylan/chitin deacetylase (PgdA/CDA1 family)
MKKIILFIRETLGFIFRFSGIPFLIREIICKNKVTIVHYHNPKPDIFKKHIEYLSRKFVFISLHKLIFAIQNKDWSSIPPKSLVITIDDGNQENYKLLEVFKIYNIYPTIYLCSHIINTNRKFWWKTGYYNFQVLKNYANKVRLKELKNLVGYEPKKDYSTRQALNLEEIREMLYYVDFQSHSKFHPILTKCDAEECRKEIEGSKNYLEKLLNKEISHFCYPGGSYTDREIEYIKNCGYKSARTLDIGWNYINSNPFRLRAMGIEDNASINILCAQVCGLFGYLRYLRYKIINKKQLLFI